MIQVLAVWRLAARRRRDARLHNEDSASHNEDESSGYDSDNGDDCDVDDATEIYRVHEVTANFSNTQVFSNGYITNQCGTGRLEDTMTRQMPHIDFERA
jgi:hypothetical protein